MSKITEVVFRMDHPLSPGLGASKNEVLPARDFHMDVYRFEVLAHRLLPTPSTVMTVMGSHVTPAQIHQKRVGNRHGACW